MIPMQAATRETFWTIGPVGKAAFYWLAAVAIAVFCYGVYARFAAYARGGADPRDRLSGLPTRTLAATRTVLSNENQFDGDRYAGVMHTFVLWGFLVLLVATTVLGVDIDVYRPLAGESFWVGEFYLVYQFAVDAFGLLFVVGVAMAIARRYRDRDGR
ncbi:Fe-S oxidoreductase, partial [Halorubrum sp. SD626R]